MMKENTEQFHEPELEEVAMDVKINKKRFVSD
jgi:hypothetical protein